MPTAGPYPLYLPENNASCTAWSTAGSVLRLPVSVGSPRCSLMSALSGFGWTDMTSTMRRMGFTVFLAYSLALRLGHGPVRSTSALKDGLGCNNNNNSTVGLRYQ